MSCIKSELALAPRTPICVNGVTIDHDAISREAQHHPAGSPFDAWTCAARALVVREMLLQHARKTLDDVIPAEDENGRSETDDEAMIRTLLDQEVHTPEPDETTCERYYQRNIQRFRSADIYEASHILIAAQQNDRDAFRRAKGLANNLISLLGETPDVFAELAAAHSTCSSASSGGSLGQITQGDTTSEFEEALVKLKPGELTTEPVETRYGWHIIKLERKIDGQIMPFDAMHERIAAYLSDKCSRAASAQYLARLASRTEISGIDLPRPADLRVY